MMSLRAALVLVAGAACALAVAPPCFAADASQTATASATTTITVDGYELDFALPASTQDGCMACHGDPNLRRANEYSSRRWGYPMAVATSAHSAVRCIGCHLDYSFTTPHSADAKDWSAIASYACRNCHKESAVEVSLGAHQSPPGAPSSWTELPKTPSCASCHGDHLIVPKDKAEGGRAVKSDRSEVVCGGCHPDYWNNYSDYYHGAAYRRGASDAPACWDCHEPHEARPSSDPSSSVNPRNVVETCKRCHPNANAAYVEYAELIHGRATILNKVFLRRWMLEMRDGVGALFTSGS